MEVRSYPTEQHEASAAQSWEAHPLGQTQDASKPGEPLQQPRWRLCSGEVLMTYQLRMEKELEERAAVTLRKADLRNEHQTNIAHV